MHTKLIGCVLACACLLAILAPAAPVAAAASAQLDQDPADAGLRPVDIEIRSIVSAERAALDELFARFAAATDLETALAIQKSIRQLRRDTQIEVLEAQLRHARGLGLTDQIAHLEECLARMRDPEAARRTLIQPVEREQQDGGR